MDNKKRFQSLLLGIGLVGMATLLSSFVLSVENRKLPENYAHWDKKSVPISLQCAACHPAQFRTWCGSDHAWALRNQESELDDEPFSGKILRVHDASQRFTIGADGRGYWRIRSRDVSFQRVSLWGIRRWCSTWCLGREERFTPQVRHGIRRSVSGLMFLQTMSG